MTTSAAPEAALTEDQIGSVRELRRVLDPLNPSAPALWALFSLLMVSLQNSAAERDMHRTNLILGRYARMTHHQRMELASRVETALKAERELLAVLQSVTEQPL